MTEIVKICAHAAVMLAMLWWLLAMLYPDGWFLRNVFKYKEFVLESDFRRFAEKSVGYIVILTPILYLSALSNVLGWDERFHEVLGTFGAVASLLGAAGVILATLTLIAAVGMLVNGLDQPEKSWLGRRLLKSYNKQKSKYIS